MTDAEVINTVNRMFEATGDQAALVPESVVIVAVILFVVLIVIPCVIAPLFAAVRRH